MGILPEALKQTSQEGGGEGTGAQMPIPEAKAGRKPPARAMLVRGTARSPGHREAGTQRCSGTGEEEAVMGSHVCTACGISVLDKGARLCFPRVTRHGHPLGHQHGGDSAGVGGGLSPPWHGRVRFDQESICCQLSFSRP